MSRQPSPTSLPAGRLRRGATQDAGIRDSSEADVPPPVIEEEE